MKLLLDNNISFRLIKKITDIFPESSHVRFHGLIEAEDHDIWHFAKEKGFHILTKDSDFNDLAIVKKHPPKIIWLKTGNCSIDSIETSLRKNFLIISEFINTGDESILEIE